MSVTECDISDGHYHEDNEDRVWEEAGSDHRTQDRVIREHVWAGDEEGEASGGGGWTPGQGATLHRKHRYFPPCFVSHQNTLHPSTLDFIIGPINNESFYCSHSQGSEGISM